MMLSRFEVVATAAALVCGLLGALWLAVPQLPLALFQIDSGQGALLVGQRGGALFAGLAVVFAGARRAPPSAVRHTLAKGFTVSCVLLAALGMVCFARGQSGYGIWLAIVTEIAFAVGFALTLRETRSERT